MISTEEQINTSRFSEGELSEIRGIISRFPRIQKVLLFGSRAKGCAELGSDVDLAVCGEALTEEDIFRLHEALSEESDLPYFFDVLDYATLDGCALKDHIDRVGLMIYEQGRVD